MRIVYNGIDLMVQETIRYDMEPVYDDTGTDYLYTRHIFVGRALVNGQADVFTGRRINGVFQRSGPFMTYRRQGADLRGVNDPLQGARNLKVGDLTLPRPEWGANNVGFMYPGVGTDEAPRSTLAEVVSVPAHPILTLDAVRFRLMSPRGTLAILAGGWGEQPGTAWQGPYQLLVMTPALGYSTDCKNGPSPRLLSVTQALGDAETLVVEFAVEAFVTDAADNGVVNPGLLLSNRYSQNQIILDNGHTVVQTQGIALFRTDVMYARRLSPDTWRSILVLPIPSGFVRGNIQVQGLADATGVHYSFEDRQVPVNFAAAPYAKAAEIHALHRQSIIAGQDALKGALSAYERVLGMMANRKFASQREDSKPKIGRPVEPYSPAPAP